MQAVDLSTFVFDYDLTLAALLMHPDGTVYHRFGGRDERNPEGWNTIAGLAALLRRTLPEHRRYDADPRPPELPPPRTVVELPPLQRKRAGEANPSCVHCHTVHDTLHAHALETGTRAPDAHFVYPSPARVGLRLEPAAQDVVAAVEPDSPAAAAGLRPGDRLLRLGAQPSVATLGDVQWALHVAPAGDTEIEVTWLRDGEELRGALALREGWKRAPPEEYAWRPYKWNLTPDPGFGGRLLDAARKRALGLPEDAFALRIGYLIDWGDRAHRGQAARAAGLRVGDVVVSFAGEDRFASHDHFQTWVRLRCKVGDEVEVVVWRDGKRVPLQLTLPR